MRLSLLACTLGVTGSLATIERRSGSYYPSQVGAVSSNPAPSRIVAGPSSIIWTTAPAASSSMVCHNPCYNYNSILVSCQSDASQPAVYDSCVCNDPNFQTYIQECISCEGSNSAPYEQQQKCKSVAPACSYACSQFGEILSTCGDSSSPGFESCVCSGAYDQTYTTTFNQAFNDCVVCENGGGQAAEWEAKCCVSTHGCNGMSAQASQLAAQMMSGPSSSPSIPSSSTTSSGFAPHRPTPMALANGIAQVLLGIGVGLL